MPIVFSRSTRRLILILGIVTGLTAAILLWQETSEAVLVATRFDGRSTITLPLRSVPVSTSSSAKTVAIYDSSSVNLNTSVIGIAVNITTNFTDQNGFVRVLAETDNGHELLVFEAAYPYNTGRQRYTNICDETCALSATTHIRRIRVVRHSAEAVLSSVRLETGRPDTAAAARRHHRWLLQRVRDINDALERDQRLWRAAASGLALEPYNVRRKILSPWVDRLPLIDVYGDGYFDTNAPLEFGADSVQPGPFSARLPSLAVNDPLVGKPLQRVRVSDTRWGVAGQAAMIATSSWVRSRPLALQERSTVGLGVGTTWDNAIIYNPRFATTLNGDVYQDPAGRMYMYYVASGRAAGVDRDRTGLALVSHDRQIVTRQSDQSPQLDFGPAGSFDDEDVQVGSVIVEDGRWYAWYAGNSSTNEDEVVIGRATSNDGINWQREHQPVIFQNMPEGTADLYQPIVRQAGTMFHLWFVQHDQYQQLRILHAHSQDIDGPWVVDDMPVLDPGYDVFLSDIWLDGTTWRMAVYNPSDPIIQQSVWQLADNRWSIIGLQSPTASPDRPVVQDTMTIQRGQQWHSWFAQRQDQVWSIAHQPAAQRAGTVQPIVWPESE